MRKFKCILGWARNQVDDIVDEYVLKRYPIDVQIRHFEEVIPKPPKKKTVRKKAVKKTVQKEVITDAESKKSSDDKKLLVD